MKALITMEASRIVAGVSYEGKGNITRRVLAIKEGMVEYCDECAGYWPSVVENSKHVSLEAFARWALCVHPMVGPKDSSPPPEEQPIGWFRRLMNWFMAKE